MATALLLRAATSDAASYLPGTPEPDPPTGDVGGAAPEDAVQGNGIRWELAPVRVGGRVALEGRWLRLETGATNQQALLFNEVELATHVWQPWFIQLRGGLGVLLGRDHVQQPGSQDISSSTAALTGRLGVLVFPASRFPFELRAEVSDSRAGGDTLGSDYRQYRLSLNQSYRTESGRDVLTFGFDRSRLSSERWGSDTVSAFNASAQRYLDAHTLELNASLVTNERSDSDDHSRFASLTGRHTFAPVPSMQVDTLASWSDTELKASTFRYGADVRQISTFATWRPREGESLHFPDAPLYLTASARLLESVTGAPGSEGQARSAHATLAASQDLSRSLRVAASVSGTISQVEGADPARAAAASVNATYSPVVEPWGEWRYTPTISVNAGLSRSSTLGERRLLGGQFNHALGRSFQWDDGSTLSLSLSQSLGALKESETEVLARTVAHSVGLYWQTTADSGRQSFVGLTASDARNVGRERGEFQLVNLQLSQRLQTSRYSSWSGNLTLQGSRSDTTLVDAFTGTVRLGGPDWQRYYNGTLTYEHQRAFDVPRLRLTVLLGVSSQQFEQRIFGDIDAPRELVSESIEGRLDYSIGRLDTRLSARTARVDGRRVSGVFARVQRNY